MRLVIDTNVIVSALLNPGRTPERALSTVFAEAHVVLYDERVWTEYAEVLARKKFAAIDPARKRSLLDSMTTHGQLITVPSPFTGGMKDEDDRVFVEVALAGRADAIVTGNVKDYPLDLAVAVLAPAELLARLAAS